MREERPLEIGETAAFGAGPDDDDAALFAAGAAVLRWDADCRSWFHAALANGRTHLAVDVRTAAKVADLLVQNDAAAQFLARGARGLFDAVLCPRCAAAHWARALVALGARFGVGDARAARAALRSLGGALTPFVARRPMATFDAATDAALRGLAGG